MERRGDRRAGAEQNLLPVASVRRIGRSVAAWRCGERRKRVLPYV